MEHWPFEVQSPAFKEGGAIEEDVPGAHAHNRRHFSNVLRGRGTTQLNVNNNTQVGRREELLSSRKLLRKREGMKLDAISYRVVGT